MKSITVMKPIEVPDSTMCCSCVNTGENKCRSLDLGMCPIICKEGFKPIIGLGKGIIYKPQDCLGLVFEENIR